MGQNVHGIVTAFNQKDENLCPQATHITTGKNWQQAQQSSCTMPCYQAISPFISLLLRTTLGGENWGSDSHSQEGAGLVFNLHLSDFNAKDIFPVRFVKFGGFFSSFVWWPHLGVPIQSKAALALIVLVQDLGRGVILSFKMCFERCKIDLQALAQR